MSVIDAFQDDNDRAVGLMLTNPLPPPPAPAKRSVWATLPEAFGKAFPAAMAEGLAGVSEIGAAVVRRADLMRRAPNVPALEAARAEPVSGETEVSRSLRNVAGDFRPDPVTASTAEQIVFGVTKGLVKAIGYSVAAGPLAGAAAFATDEGLTSLDDMQAKGVDPNTAGKVAGLTGLAAGAGFLIPAAGTTIAKTVALTAGAGPGFFMAQQAITRDILRGAGYEKIAEQFDPLDPVGLAVATLIPAAFGGYHVARTARSRQAGAGEPIAPAPRAEAQDAPAAAPELVDAAMVHNLTLQQDARAAEPAVPPVIEPPRRPSDAPEEDAPAARAGEARAEDADPITALRERTASIEGEKPEVAAELQRVRQEAEEGTDAELGRLDADLLRVAAECSLSP